ncbi:MAG: hypothetical protein F6K40_26490 [Okeania sp. SIO3I5]|uniref:reprolysin-like metallopeptidase n=1 Tax=Okeania sp. SIO3I5 TaxID=2607805 RepID=UPI0013BA76D5|nr:hypothetical protein [Okeania sp. SIO3I5]NEQ39610.1 hypothetical protein [Okeania sp. SIO3I5]
MSIGNRVKSGLYSTTTNNKWTTWKGVYQRLTTKFFARLDVDGTDPQMQFSVCWQNPTQYVLFIAKIQPAGTNKWEGDIWYRYKDAHQYNISGIKPNKMSVEYHEKSPDSSFLKFDFYKDKKHLIGESGLLRTSDYFRQTQLELDYEKDVDYWLTYDTSSLPRPAGVAAEELTLEKIYGRAGIKITRSAAVNAVSSAGAGTNARWNTQELHDAMIANWSRKEGDPWAMWVFFAKSYENFPGYVTFGVMFDDIGTYQRSGTAIFSQAIEDYYPSWINNRDAIIKRHHFRTMIHEIGHAFNLAHSWQKQSGSRWHSSVVNEPNAGSFMNYPRKVAGGEDAYWRDFGFRFSDQELLFLRHAPEAFVSMGSATWFTNHADRESTMELMEELSGQDPESVTLQLDLRVNKQRPVFEFMEPVTLELKLKNISNKPRSVDKSILKDIGHITIDITRNQSETKQYRSYSQPCFAHEKITLQPGESLFSNLFLSAGSLGWYIADPGSYEITITLSAEKEDDEGKEIVSSSFSLVVLRPSPQKRREEEKLAQDVFSDDVGRILAFQGSRILESGNDILQELTERLPQANAVPHAKVALALPKLKNFKTVDFSNGQPQVKVQDAKLEEASQELQKVLVEKGTETADTLGNIGFKQISDQLSQELEDKQDNKTAVAIQENVIQVMDKRGVKLPTQVKQEIESKVNSLKSKS